MALDILSKFSNNIAGTYDPLAVLPIEFSTVRVFASAQECIMASDALVVMTPWNEFLNLDFNCLPRERLESFIVIDPYGIIDQKNLPKQLKVKSLTEI